MTISEHFLKPIGQDLNDNKLNQKISDGKLKKVQSIKEARFC